MNPDFELPGDIVGRWSFDSEAEDRSGVLVIESTGRAVQFATIGRRLIESHIMCLWFIAVDPVTLTFGLQPGSLEWTREVKRTEAGFVISTAGYSCPLKPITNSDLPEWFEEDYQAAIQRMIEQEYLLKGED